MKTRNRTDFIVIHCSATDDDLDIGFAEIDRWHRAKGWQMCGYHLIIRRDGKLETGRELGVSGAHVEGYNSRSVGICMVGGVDADDGNRARDNFTSAQWDTLREVVASLRMKYPRATVQGHRDFPGVAKACPSFDVAAWLARVGISNPAPKE